MVLKPDVGQNAEIADVRGRAGSDRPGRQEPRLWSNGSTLNADEGSAPARATRSTRSVEEVVDARVQELLAETFCRQAPDTSKSALGDAEAVRGRRAARGPARYWTDHLQRRRRLRRRGRPRPRRAAGARVKRHPRRATRITPASSRGSRTTPTRAGSSQRFKEWTLRLGLERGPRPRADRPRNCQGRAGEAEPLFPLASKIGGKRRRRHAESRRSERNPAQPARASSATCGSGSRTSRTAWRRSSPWCTTCS